MPNHHQGSPHYTRKNVAAATVAGAALAMGSIGLGAINSPVAFADDHPPAAHTVEESPVGFDAADPLAADSGAPEPSYAKDEADTDTPVVDGAPTGPAQSPGETPAPHAVAVELARAADAGTPVATVDDLVAAVAAAPAGVSTVLRIVPEFPALTTAPTLRVPAGADVVLTGTEPQASFALAPTATSRHLLIEVGAGAQIELRDLRFLGHNVLSAQGAPQLGNKGGGVDFTAPAGAGAKAVVTDSVFEGVYGSGAISGGGGIDSIAIQTSSFIGNTGGTSGGALNFSGGAIPSLTITGSTFVHNSGQWPNYPGGAIYIKSGRGDVRIDGSVFTHSSTAARGGAIGVDYMSGSFTVSNSVFEQNTNDTPTSVNATQTRIDGGAIGITTDTTQNPLSVLIDSSTFTKNRAFDEGGAVFIENPSSADNVIRNSTFFANTSANLQKNDGNDGGGAVEIALTTAAFDHDTFVGNVAERGNLFLGAAQHGGAIATHSPGGPLLFSNTVAVNNYVTNSAGVPFASTRSNVHAGSGWTDLGGNLGIDGGKALPADVTVENVFGLAEPELLADESPVLAGDPRWANDGVRHRIPGTIPILPADTDGPATGLADNAAASTTGVDARGFPRDLAAADSGAVEIDWLRTDANGGDFATAELLKYTGTFWRDSTTDPVVTQYLVHHPGAAVSTPEAPTNAPDGMEFTGWNTERDGSGIDPFTGIRAVLTGDVTVYAQWEAPDVESIVRVHYVDTEGYVLVPEVVLTGIAGELYESAPVEIDGYELVQLPPNALGYYGEEPVDVYYVYDAVAGPVDPEPEPTDPPTVDPEPTDPPVEPTIPSVEPGTPPTESSVPPAAGGSTPAPLDLGSDAPQAGQKLPWTGASVGRIILAAGVLVIIGVATVLGVRRRKTD